MNEKFYGTAGVNAGRDTDCGCGNDERYGKPGHKSRTKLLKKIQEYNFMMIEAALFLNNQCDCEAAHEAFCKYQKLYLETLAEYEECYGPLTYNGVNVKRDGWKWANSPWPWEVEDC